MEKKLIICLLTIGLSTFVVPLFSQNSSVIRYDAIHSDSTIIGTNKKSYTYVTCSHTSDDRSCFIVKNMKRAVMTKAFYTSQHVDPIPHIRSNIGYWVSDVVVTSSMCYFCGTKWEETGLYIYLPNGLAYPETIFCSYVGWFNLFDALDNGGGNFNTIEFDGVRNFKKIVTEGYNIVAISDDKVFEFYDFNNNSCSYKKGIPQWSDEFFMDIAITGDTIVTLSRFSDTNHYFYYHDYFGLRYGSTTNFINNNNRLYTYDVYWSKPGEGDTWGRFRGLDPVKMTQLCNNNDVMVSYMASDMEADDPIPGHVIMFHIPNKNSTPSEIMTNIDTSKYRILKDQENSVCSGDHSCLALLFEDSIGRSVIRYPMPGQGYGIYNDTIKRITTPHLDEIAVGRDTNVFGKYLLVASGTFPSDNKVAEVRDLKIRTDQMKPPIGKLNCFGTIYGTFSSEPSIPCSHPENDFLIPTQGERVILSHPYTTFSVQTTATCINGFTPFISE